VQDAACPPVPSWQVSSPVGVEPGAQQASPSDVNCPGQLGAAKAELMLIPARPKIVTAAAKVTAATNRRLGRRAGIHDKGVKFRNRRRGSFMTCPLATSRLSQFHSL
jgi:hypothetical protein